MWVLLPPLRWDQSRSGRLSWREGSERRLRLGLGQTSACSPFGRDGGEKSRTERTALECPLMTAVEPASAGEEHYAEVNVTDWPVVGDEALGTKPKRWLMDPRTGNRWLMKDCTYNRRSDGTMYRKGDDWSERIANGVAGRLGLPAARTELAVDGVGDGRRFGVISKSVLALPEDETGKEELVDGNQLLSHPTTGRDRTGYSISAVREALDGVRTPSGVEGHLNAWEVFVGYLVLDAVVGNTDRHQENWAVIDSAGRRCLAPTFDHASCLGFLLDDEMRSSQLRTRDSGATPEAYADRSAAAERSPDGQGPRSRRRACHLKPTSTRHERSTAPAGARGPKTQPVTVLAASAMTCGDAFSAPSGS